MDKLSECPVCKNRHLLFLKNCFRCGNQLETTSISTKGYRVIVNIFDKFPLSVISFSLVLLSLLWNPLQDFLDIFLFYILFVTADILPFFIKWRLKNVTTPNLSLSTPLWLRMIFALVPMSAILSRYADYVEQTIWVEYLELRQLGQGASYEVPYLIQIFRNDNFLVATGIFTIFISYFAFIYWLNIKIFVNRAYIGQYPRIFHITTLKDKYIHIKRFGNQQHFILNWYLLLAVLFAMPISILLIAGLLMGFTTYPTCSYNSLIIGTKEYNFY